MYQPLIKNLKGKMESVLEHFREDISSVRTGRATPSLVEDIVIEVYNAKMPLKQVAAIQAPDPRTLFIQPWDKNIVKTIEKAIAASPLKLMPTLDGDVLRISIPSLTEEKRKELLKILKDKMEQARVRVRREREEVWDEVQKMQKESKITEDDKYVAKEELQKMVDQYNGKIEEMGGKKEKEIMTV